MYRFTDAQLDYIKVRYSSVSAIVIAAELSVSPQTIVRQLNKLGVPLQGSGRRTDPERKQIRRQKARVRELKQEYGITPEHYAILLQAQKGVCNICHQPETRLSQSGVPIHLSVDHCHKTGKIRGLLCYSCNLAIALLHDNAEHCIAAAQHLTQGGPDE